VLNGKIENGSENRRKEEIVKADTSRKNSPDLAFLVQFCDLAEVARFSGRAEHVMSGQNSAFETPEELADFFGRVINHSSSGHERA
jgi:hypothetical protein